MSNWKFDYTGKYKGRGNCWVKILYSSPVSKVISKKLNSFKEKGLDISNYVSYCDRQSFYWLRYHKVIGTKDNPFIVYEIRINGSKLDHKENLITIPAKIASKFPLLGNTPHKLNLEASDSELLLLKSKTSISKEKVKCKVEDEEIVRRARDSLSYPEGSMSPLINFKLPGKEDIQTFKNFLEYENAL